MPASTADVLKGRPATLERWPGERRDRHRALLLWAMQTPADRSLRAVARALGCSDGSVRNWRRTGAWDQRAHSHGEDSDQHALDLYRGDYMAEFGRLEVPHVAGRVVRPMGALDLRDPAAQAAHDAAQRTAAAVPTAQAEVEQATAQAVATRRADERQVAERHVRLVDAALGTIAKKLKADEVRVGVRDIPVLLECRERLTRVVAGVHDTGGGAVVESARVKHAKETGGDLVAAMHEDALELVAILGAMRTAQGANRAGLAAADQRVRAEAG